MDSGNPATLYDYDVVDSEGNKVGTVQGVWVDDATNELEFIGVQSSVWTRGVHVVPAAGMQMQDNAIQVAYTKEQVDDAPRFSHEDVLSPDDENRVYGYYGLTRSTSVSPTGLPAQSGADSSGSASVTASTPASVALAEGNGGDGSQLRKLDRGTSTSTTPVTGGNSTLDSSGSTSTGATDDLNDVIGS